MNFNFYLRESAADVTDNLFMSDIPGTPIELDYVLGQSQGITVVQNWISPAAMPNVLAWPAGVYTFQLNVIAAPYSEVPDTVDYAGISIGAQLWRCDALGNDLEQIGVTTPFQTAAAATPSNPAVLTFTFTDPTGSSINQTDRLHLKLEAQNTETADPFTLSIMSSSSTLVAPIQKPTEWSLRQDFRTRGKFLGKFRRAGEGAPEGAFDQFGVDLPC